METKLKLISAAQTTNEQHRAIAENFNVFAKALNEDGKQLMEAATHVIAGIKQLMSGGQPLTQLGLSPASIAGIVAGIEVLVSHLPKLDNTKKPRVLKLLGDLALGSKMNLATVQAIANLAEKNPRIADIKAAFETYAKSNQADPAIIQLLGKMQQQVDSAISTATAAPQAAPQGQLAPAM